MDKTDHPDEIFHYTSIGGLLGIIQSKCLHASHIEFMNDRMEMRYADDLIRPLLVPAFRECFSHLQRQVVMTGGFDMDWLCEHEASNLLAAIRRTSNRLAPLFVVSFCRATSAEIASDGLLSQWRGYGVDGGVAIVFDQRGISTLIESERAKFQLATISFGDVIYGPNDPEFESIIPNLELYKSAAATIIEMTMNTTAAKNLLEHFPKVPLEELFQPYSSVQPMLKHPSFREENEYRLTLSVGKNGFVESDSLAEKGVKFKQRGNYLIPYIELHSNDGPALPILRVIVGPSVEGERRRDSVEMLLREHGHSIPVSLSKIPLT
ncbi:DUF2971 domain-containing protein [Kaistia soli]|uniref:DUF2971 domain-containing protein n=1 Tax=Kaistia soli TaxID=446684 RepID=UPI0009341866|nr:DUF2971 domain-containing protein [Kaistia soli]